MLEFRDLKRLAKAGGAGLRPLKVALLGDCATQLLALALRGQGVQAGFDLDLFEADYDQVDRQVLDPGSELVAFAPEVVVLQLTAEKFAARFARLPEAERPGLAAARLAHLEDLLAALARSTRARVVVFNLAEIDDGVYGNFANKTAASLLYQLRRYNLGLMELAQQHGQLFVLDLALLQARHGRRAAFDPTLYLAAKMPLALDVLPAVAHQVVGILAAVSGRVRKCLVLDLDNTVWGGVVGDDGPANLQLGELGQGPAFTALQLWARQLRERGVLLCACSKNLEETAKEPFRSHPDMVLRLEDFAMFVANWEDKVTNLRQIQATLQIGFDSMVFVDDNPFEREMVRSMLPDVCVPELPEDPARYVETLVGLNLFEVATLSEADRERTAQYQREAERERERATFASVEDYLQSLAMTAVASPFDAFHTPRLAQLSQRSNQFNLRTVRYDEAEIARLMVDERFITRYFTLADRFGEHGLVAMAVLEARPDGAWFIDTWLMSCRVLKRGMEDFVLNELAAAALARGGKALVGEYLPTAKNALVRDLLASCGFVEQGGLWYLSLATFVPRAVPIQRSLKP